MTPHAPGATPASPSTGPAGFTGVTEVTEVTEITLLTQSDCGLCEHAKQVLARVGADHRLRISEVDLASARGQDLAAHAGVMFAPGVLVNGHPFSFGRLSERRLRRTLGSGANHTRQTDKAGGARLG